MPEFLTLLPPDEARQKMIRLLAPLSLSTVIETAASLGRVTAEDILAPHPLPEFPRSTVDGFAVKARDTHGASESLPAYLKCIGEIPMGAAPSVEIQTGQTVIIHTGGMLPAGADAVVMLEYTQTLSGEIEILRAVADGENVIRVGEDVSAGQVVIPKGSLIRPAELGGLMALGINKLRVTNKPRVGLISSGDEVISPEQEPKLGQIRDINAYTLAALIEKAGGLAVQYGIVSDEFDSLKKMAAKALNECDVVVITAGSSASTRDMTADVIRQLGEPGVLVHGINTKPGKPTILGVCGGKAVLGLPGNPVSALVNGYLFLEPVIHVLAGLVGQPPKGFVPATLTVNLASQAGREDWQPVRLAASEKGWMAEPIFGKSNLIFNLVSANGLIKIPADATGLSAGETVNVFLI